MMINVGKTIYDKSPMTGNSLYHLKKMVMTGGWFMALFYP